MIERHTRPLATEKVLEGLNAAVGRVSPADVAAMTKREQEEFAAAALWLTRMFRFRQARQDERKTKGCPK